MSNSKKAPLIKTDLKSNVDWLKNELHVWTRLEIGDVITHLLFLPVGVLFFALILFLVRSITGLSPAAMFIPAVFIFIVVLFVVLIVFSWITRNNPYFTSYYIFRMSRFTQIVLIAGLLFVLGLFIYTVCSDVQGNLTTTCAIK